MSRIEESITKLQNYINDVEVKAKEQINNVEDDRKTQIEAVANKTISTIKNSIEKLESMKTQSFDENELEDFLNRLDEKCKDVCEYTKKKIEAIKPAVKVSLADLKDELDKGFDEIKKDGEIFCFKAEETYDKLKENENVKKAIELAKAAKEKAIEFYNKPETQEAINNAKLKIIDVAEKGLDTLKVILEKDDKKS